MEIAITAPAPNPDADIDPRFGWCRYFVIADPAKVEFDTLNNSGAAAGGGAGYNDYR